MTIDAHDAPASDADLVAEVRGGGSAAYGELYSRHLGAARAFALRLTTSAAEADDCVADAFAKVLEAIRAGGGPEGPFRPYLLRAVRNHVYSGARHLRRTEATDDLDRHDPGQPFVDPVVEELERTLVTRAFRTLPERWQTTLWHTAVEEQSSHEVADILGTTPNTVTSLAYRAREGLRQAYLDCYLADHPHSPCARQVRRLGRYVRGALGVRATRATRQHLASCAECAALERELVELSSAMRAVVGPALVGASLAGFLADRGVGTAAPWVERSADATPAWMGWTTRVAGVGLATLAVVPFVLDVGEPHRPVPPQAIRTPATPSTTSPPTTPAPAPSATPSATPSPSTPSTTERRPAAGGPPAPRPSRRPPSTTQVRPDDAAPPPRPSPSPTRPPAAPPAEAAPEVQITIGEPVEEYARTTVPLTVVNRTGSADTAIVDLLLPEMMHLDPSASSPCSVSGAGREARLSCGSLGDGARREVSVALLPDDNGDGTFSDQQGDLHAGALVGRTRADATRFVRVVC